MVLLAVWGPGAVAADEPVTGRLAGAFCGEAIGGCEPPCGGLVGWPIIVPELVPPVPVVEFVWARARDVVPSKRAPIAPIVFNFVIAYSRMVIAPFARGVSQPTRYDGAFFRRSAGAHN